MEDIYKISTTYLKDMMTDDIEGELDFPITSSHLKRQTNIPFISITCKFVKPPEINCLVKVKVMNFDIATLCI